MAQFYVFINWAGKAGGENIWFEVKTYGPSAARSVRPDREAKYVPVRPDLTQAGFH